MEDSASEGKLLKLLSGRKILIPILLGLGVVVWMFHNEFDLEVLKSIEFTWWTAFWIIMAVVMMCTRDVGYIMRIHTLSGGQLTWIQSFRIIMLWEFTSAVTPSAIGGTSIALLYIYKEGISIGKGTSMVLATSILDETYFIVMFPLLLLIISPTELFTIGETTSTTDLSNEFLLFAVIGYSLKLVFTLFVMYGLFVNPQGLKKILLLIFRLPIIRRWKDKIEKAGDDIVVASGELKTKNFKFWLKTVVATFLSWTARYWVVNCLFLAFFPATTKHFLIFARQLVMWIMMLVMPTPGGSGFAEFVFKEFLGEFIPIVGFIAIIVVLWRIITYYVYLLMGAVVLPAWLRKKF